MGETGLELAVIGMSGRFPGARTIDEFWENLKQGVESLVFYSEEELEAAGNDAELLKDSNYVKTGGGILEEVEFFDAAFFDYVPNEALVMNPQTRLFHEYAWQALEHAGYDPHAYKEKIGLYAGASFIFSGEILTALLGKVDEVGRFVSPTLAGSNSLSTRVAYKLNLKGPGLIVQTACSTSLAAIVLACQGILSGQCNMALAGGVSASTVKQRGYVYKEGMTRSVDGHCRAFDAAAKGLVSGEGIGIVVLKLLEDSLVDGDTIHAVIKGFAVNNDGNRRVGYTAPSIEGQAEVIRAAHLMAEVEPESITYIETHGTGTSLGDPVEIEALKQGFGTGKKGFCRIGSVKTNIGHLDAAAGAAGFIKTVLALKHRQIPPSLHFENPNPKIDFENNPFCVNTRLTEWKNNKYPLRAGVSSFGIGGTNVHVVLEQAPRTEDRRQTTDEYQLIFLSAKTESALDKMTKNLAEYFKNILLNHGNHENPINPGLILADAAYTLHIGRKAFNHRRVLVCSQVEEAVEVLLSGDSRKTPTYFTGSDHPRVIFVFPGLGAHYVNMGRDLYEKESLFRQEMDRCFNILSGLLDYDIKEILYPTHPTPSGHPSQEGSRGGSPCPPNNGVGFTGQGDHRGSPLQSDNIHRTEIAQPLIFAIEYALAKLLVKWGIKPHAMIGYSFGEYTAACIAGVFSPEDALELIVTRGQLMKKVPGGVLLSVPLSKEELSPLLPRELSMAIDNGPSCIVGGTSEAVLTFESEMKQRRCLTMRVPNSHAVHTHMMRPILKEFQHHLSQLRFKPPQIPYVSNVTGEWQKNGSPVDAAYWVRHLEQTVRFADGIKQLLTIPNPVFIEVGPGRDLVPLVMRHADTDPTHRNRPQLKMINLVRHPERKVSDIYYLLNKIGQLWLYGCSIDGHGFYAGRKRYRIPLPTYPFERQHYWMQETHIDIDHKKLIKGKVSKDRQVEEELAAWFYLPNWKRAVVPFHNLASPESGSYCWLVFLDRHGIGALLKEALEKQGHKLVTVEPGPGFAKPNPDRYTINPDQPGDYRQLFNHWSTHWASQEKTSPRLLHLWTLTGERQEAIETLQTLGFYSLLNIVKALGKIGAGSFRQFHLDVISDHWHDVTGEEELEPGKRTMSGLLKVIPQEHPYIRCRGIDIVCPPPGNPRWEILEHQLLAELVDVTDSAVAFRGPHRLIRHFDSIRQEAVTAKQLPLRKKGVYLITGGLGRIGLILAGYLAGEFSARLILTGRSPLTSSEKIKKIRELESLGAEVMAVNCDVSDEHRMGEVINRAVQRWGGLHGVIHAAGNVHGSSLNLIRELEPGTCQGQFQAKISGTLVLEKLLRDKNLDFCWLMSSISTVLGGLRFAAYAAANSFMDAFVSQLRRRGYRQWISVDWDGMPKQKTIEAFKRILYLSHNHGNISRLAVSNGGNLQARIDRWINFPENESGVLHPRPQLFNPYVPPADNLQGIIAETWEKIFGFEQIGVQDDFLELGGDSLKAITLISALHKQFNVEIPLPVFFNNPTVEKLAEYIKNAAERSSYTSISPVETKEYYPLSSAQKRIYFLQQMDAAGTSYNMPLVFPLGKDMEKDRIELTLKRLIARHESLRTSFRMIGEEPVQMIHEKVEFEIEYYDLTPDKKNYKIKNTNHKQIPNHKLQITSKKETKGHHSSFNIHHLFVRPFDLSRAPLIRSGLIRHPDNNYTWLLDLHHIVSDGTSCTILTEDFKELYNEEAMTPLAIQYKDFSQWQNRLFESNKIIEQEEYWLGLYSDEIPRLNLPTDFKRPEVFTFAGDSYSFTLVSEAARQFKTIGAEAGGTLYMNILAALNTLFYIYTGQTDIIIGSGIAGRNHTGLQRVVGMFVNSLAMRNYPKPGKTYRSFLKEVINGSIQAFAHQDVQFEELVERLDPVRDPSRNPLFDISMVVQNFRKPQIENTRTEILPTIDEESIPAGYKNTRTKFDMTFFVREPGEDVHIAIEYYTGIFKLSFIQRLTSHLKNVIKIVGENPAVKLEDIDILSREEKEQVLYEFNNTAADYPGTAALHEEFVWQAGRTPGSVVLHGSTDEQMHRGVHITYHELNRRADQTAGYLGYKKGLNLEEPVGILMNQSINLAAAILGILKAGGCYVPIDPSLPRERIKHIIMDAGIGIVISVKKHIRTLNRLQWECSGFHSYLCMDSEDIHGEEEQEISELMDVELWRHVGESAADDITGGGWLSSFTGQPFSRKEMDEYGDNILEKLLPRLHPRMHVLEIGCATGITMYRIAPKVELYYGTDLSQVIIDKNIKKIKQEGHKNIILKTMPAHEIHQLKAEKNNFHLIIINSVIQCFPGHNYLRKVNAQCMDLLADQGYLFIGDVMDQEKKQNLVQELADFKRNNRDKGYTTKTDFSAELFVSRGFWEDMSVEFSQVEAIEISDKIYTIENELTKYRYDVLITVNKRATAPQIRDKCKHQDDLRCLWSIVPEGVTWKRSLENLAYIIYTSGTTGMPKGVAVEHRSTVNLCYWHHRAYHITRFDRAALYAAVGFDASVWELFPYLLKGSALYIVDEFIKLDIHLLSQFFQRYGITISFLPTQLCELFISIEQNHSSLRALLTGGDKLRTFTETTYRLYNNYGPTENTVVTTAYPVNNLSDNIPIGKPVDNCRIYIINKESSQLQPVGIAGELCIAGDGLARGYLNKPELTVDKFCTFFYRSYKSYMSYIYRTGDLARWLEDGNIEFMGRIDQQVKIRGFRIQLEEIENRLTRHDDVREAVVITRESETDKYLCAYLVPRDGESAAPPDTMLMREYLAETLPDYMIPAYFVQLETIPLTSAGKVDRRALPEPGLKKNRQHASPGNPIEQKLTKIWSEVLGRDENFGLEDNFFELGGHSLKATSLVAKIHKEFQIKIPLAEIFKTPNIRSISDYLKKASKEKYAFIEPIEKKEYYVLSSAQKRMYILNRMEPGNINYNMPGRFPLTGCIDKEKLESIFRKLISRHESLRTSFHLVEDEPVQKIHDEVEFEIECFGIERKAQSAEGKEERHAPCAMRSASTIKNFIRPFDLSRAPLLRVGLLGPLHPPLALRSHPRRGTYNSQEGKDQNYILVMDMHHIISDGLSRGIIRTEFQVLLEGGDLPLLKLRYKDYAQWQNNREQRLLMKHQEAYWLWEYRERPPVLQLPADFPRPSIQTFEGNTVGFLLEAAETRNLRKMAEKTNTTLFMTILSIFYILLAKLSGQEDIIVGTPIAGRRHDDFKKIIGMFVNTLALRNYPSGDKTFIAFLREVKKRTLDALENQEYQFEDLVEKVQVARDTGRNPVFDVVFNLLNPEDLNYTLDALGVNDPHLYQHKKGTAKFDLTLGVTDLGEKLLCSVEYYSKLFQPGTIDRIIAYFKKLSGLLPGDPDREIREIEIITPSEKQLILEEFNDPTADYPGNKTIHELFEIQAAQFPNRVIVIGIGHRDEVPRKLIKKIEMKSVGVPPCARFPVPEQQVTYKEIQQKANQLAHLLREKGVNADDIVGVMMERSIEMIVAFLGILKAGGAYLPIDPGYPEERIEYMLKDSGTAVLLTEERNFNYQLPITNYQLSMNKEIPTSTLTSTCQVSPTNLAYIIYTSGTTGKPKGVLIQHYNVVRLMFNNKFQFDFNECDVWTLFHSSCFDFSVWEMYGALLYGGKLVIVPKMVARNTEAFLELLKRKQVTILNQTPSAFYHLANLELEKPGKKLNTRYIIFGGEALAPMRLKEWKQKYPGTKLINMYGITETTVHVTFKEITSKEIETNTGNIGKPIPTLSVYLMDKYLKPVPIGVPGELVVGGAGVGRGYLNRPQLTFEKFDLDLWDYLDYHDEKQEEKQKVPGKINHRSHRSYMSYMFYILYKSGDLARWLANGEIEYLGRIDQQVKIRGFRIELGEIENRLLCHEDIKEAVVLSREDTSSENYLCAYIIANRKAQGAGETSLAVDSTELREYLSKGLPDYMIPAYFVGLEKIPLTPNGKVDRSALPAPGIEIKEGGAVPGNPVEEQLAAIWADVLGAPGPIGIHDNFFEIGGHSLKATVLANKIHRSFHIRIPVVEIFRIPTVREMAAWIASAQETEFTDIEKVKEKEYYELSYQQKRLWVLHQLDPQSPAFHMHWTLTLNHPVDEDTIGKALDIVVRHHESLRTGFKMNDQEPVQFISGQVELLHRTIDISHMKEHEKGKQRNKILREITLTPFQLDRPPLFRSALVKLESGKYEFIFNLHHIISDGWSIEVLKRDFFRVYQGIQTGKDTGFPSPGIQYKDFVAMQKKQLQDPGFKKEAQAFWKKKFQSEIPVLKFHGSLDKNINDKKGAAYRCTIDNRLKERLNKAAKQKNTSLFIVMFSVYILFLSRFTDQQDIACSFISAGREHASLHDIIGLFVHSLISRTRLDYREKFEDFLQQANKDILEILEYQSYPLELVFEELRMRYPDVPVSFNMLNFEGTSAGIEIKALQSRHIEESQEVKFHLEPYITEYKNGIHINWVYKKNLFTPATIEYMAGEYIKLLDYFSNNLDSNYKAYKDKGEKPIFKRKKKV